MSETEKELHQALANLDLAIEALQKIEASGARRERDDGPILRTYVSDIAYKVLCLIGAPVRP